MASTRNLHTIDRILRIVIGSVLVYIGFIDGTIITNELLSILLGLFGGVNIVAGIVATCPVYKIAGISTYSRPETGK